MNEETKYSINITLTKEQLDKLSRIKQLCALTNSEVFNRLLDLAATVTSTEQLFLVNRLPGELTCNQFIITLTDEELEAINDYAEPLSLRNYTAIKELAFKQLELITKSITNNNLVNVFKELKNIIINQEQLTVITNLINTGNYLEAMKILKELKQHTDNPNALAAIEKAIKDVSFYESNHNMTNYLNNRNI